MWLFISTTINSVVSLGVYFVNVRVLREVDVAEGYLVVEGQFGVFEEGFIRVQSLLGDVVH